MSDKLQEANPNYPDRELNPEDRPRLIPMEPGYYWAKWQIAADGTHEGDELTPASNWEIVQVNGNNVDDPNDDEYLSVSVLGVRETQWRENFVWGTFVAPLVKNGPPEAEAARLHRDLEKTRNSAMINGSVAKRRGTEIARLRTDMETIAAIAEGSGTVNSLPHIARIARASLGAGQAPAKEG